MDQISHDEMETAPYVDETNCLSFFSFSQTPLKENYLTSLKPLKWEVCKDFPPFAALKGSKSDS